MCCSSFHRKGRNVVHCWLSVGINVIPLAMPCWCRLCGFGPRCIYLCRLLVVEKSLSQMFRETDVLRTTKSRLYYTAVLGMALCSGII